MLKKTGSVILLVWFCVPCGMAMKNSESNADGDWLLEGDTSVVKKKPNFILRWQEKIEQKRRERLAKKEEKRREKERQALLKNNRDNYILIDDTAQITDDKCQEAEDLDVLPEPVENLGVFDVVLHGDQIEVQQSKDQVIHREDVVEISQPIVVNQEELQEKKEQFFAELKHDAVVSEVDTQIEKHEELIEADQDSAVVAAEDPIIVVATDNPVIHDVTHNKLWGSSIVVATLVGGGALLWVLKGKMSDKIQAWFGHFQKEAEICHEK